MAVAVAASELCEEPDSAAVAATWRHSAAYMHVQVDDSNVFHPGILCRSIDQTVSVGGRIGVTVEADLADD